MNSKREFHVTTAMRYGLEHHRIDVAAFTNNGEALEVIYAMQEITDDVLDLKVGESLYFQSNRDDKTSKGIIYRNK